MKVLTLRTKVEFIEAIIRGEKTSEYRDFVPFYVSRMTNTDKSGTILSMKEFDEVKLYAGNEKKREICYI